MKVLDILHIDSIKVKLEISNKNNLLEKMLELADKSGHITNKVDAKKEIDERERLMSTGVGKGIALPHAKTNAVTETIGALATMKTPIDYEAIDNKPVDIVFLLLGRENNVGNHLRLLSKISRLMNNDEFRSRLLHAESAEQVIEIFRQVETED